MENKDIFRMLYKGINAKCTKINNSEMIFEVEVYGIGIQTLQIRSIASEFFVRINKGTFLDKTFGSKGSMNFIQAKSIQLLSDKITEFIHSPELYYAKIQPIGKTTVKKKQVFKAVTVKIKSRKYDVILNNEEYKKLDCYIVDPCEVGIPVISRAGKLSFKKELTKMKVRGNANKAAKMSMFSDKLNIKKF